VDWTPARLRFLLLAFLAIAVALFAYQITSAPAAPPTLAEYLAFAPGRTLAPVGYGVDGTPLVCGKVQIVLNPKLDDVAAAEPGFVILNPAAFDKLPKVVRLYAFGHECGHQLHGPDETVADCAAISSGVSQKWLDAAGVQAICDFWKPLAADKGHLPGVARCEAMKQCFTRAVATK
jgi:hypothetical protein